MTTTIIPTTPAWADFPTDEYEARLRVAQRRMEELRLDVVVMIQRENVEYFSGLQTGHWGSKTFQSGAVVIHQEQDPILVVPDFFNGTADGSSWIKQRRHFTEPHARPRGFSLAVIQAIKELGADSGSVGLELGEHLTPAWNLEDYHAIRDALSNATFSSGADVIWSCRMIKSAREIERMRLITDITDQAVLETRSKLERGMTEEDVAIAASSAMINRGADGITFMNIRAGLDRYACADSLPAKRPIGPGEMLLIDVGGRRRTYTTDVAYVAHIGEPTRRHIEVYDAVIRSHEAALAATRPGVRASEVYWAGINVLKEFGFGKTLDMIGHGIGLDVHEPPMLTPYDDRILEPGMTFAIEPWLYDVTNLGFFCVEEIVLVTDTGCEVISTVPRNDLWSVA